MLLSMKWFLCLLLMVFLVNGCTPSKARLAVSQQSLELQGNSSEATFSISNEAEATSVLNWEIVSDSALLTATPAKGSLVAGASASIVVKLDRSGLEAGQQLDATLTVDSDGGRATVMVTYTMLEGGSASCGRAEVGSSTLSKRTAAPASASTYVAGELLVQFTTTSLEPQSMMSRPRNLREVAQTVAAAHGLALKAPVQAERPTLVRVPSGEDVEDFARRLESDPRVAYAEPNYYLETLAAPEDPRLSEQWHLLDFGLPQAWELQTGQAQAGKSNVVMAIIDSGIDISHVDLREKVLPGYDFFDKDTNPSPGPQSPDPNHGTHVAGIAVAVGNNAEGVAGVAYGGGVKLLPLKVFPDAPGSGNINALLDALLWAAGFDVKGVGKNPNPAQIINVSLGVKPSDVDGATLKAIEDVTKRVYDKGVIIFAAAGNDGDSTFIRSPASSPWVCAVGSVDADYRRSTFSDYATSGASVDFMAPGGRKLGSLCGSVLSTFSADNYGCLAGTSMASPFAAGVAALLLSQTPGLSPSELKAKLANGALFEPYMSVQEYGAGIVCADRALGAATRCGRSP